LYACTRCHLAAHRSTTEVTKSSSLILAISPVSPRRWEFETYCAVIIISFVEDVSSYAVFRCLNLAYFECETN
jgi:hypothetical protein